MSQLSQLYLALRTVERNTTVVLNKQSSPQPGQLFLSLSIQGVYNYTLPPSLTCPSPEVFTRPGLGGEDTGGAPGEAVAQVGSGAGAGAVGLVSLRQHVPTHCCYICVIYECYMK